MIVRALTDAVAVYFTQILTSARMSIIVCIRIEIFFYDDMIGIFQVEKVL